MEKSNSYPSDHDILVRLVETVNNNHKYLVEKITGVQSDVTDIKNDQSIKMANLETRLTATELWINNFKISWKTTMIIATCISAIVSFVITVTLFALKIFPN